MGYQVGPNCYGDVAAAVSAIASAQVGAIVSHGGSASVVGVQALGPDSITYTFTPVGGGTASTLVAAVAPQPCGLLDWQDGLALGWGIAAVWLTAGLLMAIRRAGITE